MPFFLPRLCAALALTLAFCSASKAQEFSLQLIGPPESCPLCTEAEITAFKAEQAAYQDAFHMVRDELNDIRKWMRGMGYKDPALPLTDGRTSALRLYDLRKNPLLKKNLADWESDYGSYAPGLGISINLTALPQGTDGRFGLNPQARATLAHELYHAVQEANGNLEGPLWAVEAMAEAVGIEWSGLTELRASSYGTPLHQPDDEYERGHFFVLMGRDLGATPAVDFYDDLEKRSASDGTGGLQWLETYLAGRGRPLVDYYPAFIARHAPTAAYFAGATAKSPLQPRLAPGQEGSVAGASGLVRKVATHYWDATPRFDGDWSALPMEQRIYVTTLGLDNAPDALRLVVRDQVIPKGAHFAEPVLATVGTMKTPLNLRVTNVDRAPSQSTDQTAHVRMETTRVTFALPGCMAPGQTLPLVAATSLDPETLASAFTGLHMLRPSAGRIGPDLSFTAPTTGGDAVEITLALPTLSGGSRQVSVAKTQVSATGCMTRMIAGTGLLTYTPDGDYTEFTEDGAGQATYMSADDIALFEGTWLAIPAEAKAMVMAGMASIANDGILMQLDDEVKRVDEWQSHRMPLHMAQRFSWDNLKDARTPKGTATRRVAADCPAGTSLPPCSTTTVGLAKFPFEVTFQADGMPAQIKIKDEKIRFQYGGFAMRRPPGW